MQVTINRLLWSSLPPILVEIGAEFESAPRGIKLGAAVKVFVGAERTAGRTPDLSGSNLRGSNLSGSDLRDSNLRGSNLRDSNLSGSNLRGSNLRGSNLSDSNLSGSDLRGVPIVPHIDAAILAAVEGEKALGKLDMTTWHKCETTHCRAGWAIQLAGPGGAALEWALGPAAAGSLIYLASRPGKSIPDFHATNEDALADLKACAAEDPMPAGEGR